MADSILRLRVDSQEYDNKLKRAAEGIQRYADGCRKAGGTLEHLDDGVEQFVKELGKMETTSNSAKGRINEMTKAFTDLSVEYKHLTDQEKQSPFGKALAQSLDQLKTRVQSAKQDLDDIHKSLNGATSGGGGGLFGGGKLDGMLQVLGGNLMTKGASMLAGFASEIGNCIEQGIELAKQGEGIHLAFNRLNQPGLLDNLREATHGTVTDLELMKAAVKFNDFKLPLDQLGTMLAFAQKKAKDTGQSVDYMVDSIVTGLGRKSLMILDNLGLSASEIRDKMKETGDMTKAVGEIIRDQMSKAGGYVETAADRAQQANVNLTNAMTRLGETFQPLTDTANNMWTSIKIGALDLLNTAVTPLINALTEAGRIRSQYAIQGGDTRVNRQLERLGNIHTMQYRRNTYNAQLRNYDSQINSYQQYLNDYKTWEASKRNGSPNVGAYDRMQAFKKGHNLSSYMYSDVKEQLEVFKKMRAEYVMGAKTIINDNPAPSPTSTTTTTNTPSGGGSGTTTQKEMTEMQSNQQRINELTQEYVNISDQSTADVIARQVEIRKEIALLQARNNTLKLYSEQAQGKFLGGNVQTSELEGSQFRGFAAASLDVVAGLSPKVIEEINNSLTSQISILNQQQKAYGMAAQAAQNFGSAMAGIEDPAAKAAGQVTQAIASIALGFAMASSNANTAGTGWGWLAWLGAGMGAMATTIATIHSLTGFQNGGQVKKYANGGITDGTSGGSIIGTTYSNDQIPIMANAGEVILNKAQQSTLAQNLQGNDGGGMRVVGEIQGEKIVLVANRYFKRTGQGEIVTW